VNIYNLLDAERLGIEPILFPTELALSKYTKKPKRRPRIYPLDEAKGKLMEYMLRRIWFPRRGRAGTAAEVICIQFL
jgi:hypothetical protein